MGLDVVYPESAIVTGGELQGVEEPFLMAGNGSKLGASSISTGSSESWEQISSVRQHASS